MKILVNKNYVIFDTNTKVNKKEFKATPLEFDFSEEYDGLTCKAIFSKIPKNKDEEVTFYQQAIVDGECYKPYEVLDGEVECILIGVYGYEVEGEELVIRYSPEPKNLWLLEGSYYEGASTPEEITPSQFEQYTAYLNSQIERLNQIKIETTEVSDGVVISITNADGETSETKVHNGEKGDKGEPGEPGTTDYDDLTNKPSINGYTLDGNVTLEDIGIGSVFTIKGSVATPSDLPATGNSIGDVYYVESVMAGYVWIEVDNVERWEELGEPIDLSNYYTKTETNTLLGTKQDIIQYTTIPTASSSNERQIIQYTGTTTNDYTNGYFYKCVEDSNVYSWENVNIQPSSSGDIPIYIWDGRPWSSSTPDTNADVKETWDKVIDCLLNGKPYAFYLIQTRQTGSSTSTRQRMVFNITLAYKPSSNSLMGGAVCFYSGVNYYCYEISIFNALDSNNKITSVPNKTAQAIYNKDIASYYSGSGSTGALSATNIATFNPTSDYNPATKKYVDNKLTTYSGYDVTKTQVLKNVNGTLTWVDEV